MKKQNSYIYSYIVFFFILIVPIFLNYTDLWDGTFYQYAQLVNEFDGAKLGLYQSGWRLNYWLIFFIIKISNFINIDYFFAYIILLSLFYLLFLMEVELFVFKNKLVNDNNIKYVLFLICCSSSQSFFYSSIMLWPVVCLYCAFIGVRLFISEKNIYNFLSLLPLIVAFSYKSFLLFIPCLAFFYLKNNFKPKLFFLFLIGCVIFFIFHFYFVNFGKMENYAQIIIPRSINEFLYLLRTALTYSTYFIPLFIISLLVFFYAKLKKTHSKFLVFLFDFFKNKTKEILFLLSAIIPYVAIGRSSVIWDVDDWTGRVMILFTIPVSVISVQMLEIFFKKNLINKKIFHLSFIFLLLVNLCFLFKGSIVKINRIIYQKKLSIIIKNYQNEIKNLNGIFLINDSYIIKPIFRINESNFLTYLSIGKNYLWTEINSNKDIKKQLENIQKNPQHFNEYKNYYISNLVTDKPICFILLKIQSSNFEGLKNKIKNLINNNNGKISVQNFEKNCS